MSDILRLDVDESDVRPLRTPAAVLDPATSAVVDQVVAAARAEAYAQGEAAGRAAAVAELGVVNEGIEASLQALHSALHEQRAETTAASLQLAEAVATAVLDRTPPAEATEIAARVREAISHLDPDELRVAVHPEDHALLAVDGLPQGAEWIADPSLARGEARIAGPYGGAELTRAALLQAALSVLGEAAR